MANEFKLYELNDQGKAKANVYASELATLLAKIEKDVSSARERALAATKMQELLAVIVRGIGMQKAYQVEEE